MSPRDHKTCTSGFQAKSNESSGWVGVEMGLGEDPGCSKAPGGPDGPRVARRPQWRQTELKLHKNRQITTSFGFESAPKLWVSVEEKLFPQFTPIAWNCSAWNGARACMNLAKNEQNHRSGVPVGGRVTSVPRPGGGSHRRACGGRPKVPVDVRAASTRRSIEKRSKPSPTIRHAC